jgi:hypothetical protein
MLLDAARLRKRDQLREVGARTSANQNAVRADSVGAPAKESTSSWR